MKKAVWSVLGILMIIISIMLMISAQNTISRVLSAVMILLVLAAVCYGTFLQKQASEQSADSDAQLPENSVNVVSDRNESTNSTSGMDEPLLTQISDGLKNNEFTCYLHPCYDLNTRKITGAEALVRWNHPSRGVLGPSAFFATIESSGYITRLDRYIWELVCSTLRGWLDSGMIVVPISVNISKLDILAMDVAKELNEIVQKYEIPHSYIEIEIGKNAYLEASAEAIETERALRWAGYRVLMDGFDGDFTILNTVSGIQADAYKLNMRYLKTIDWTTITELLQHAKSQQIKLEAVAIERIEQLHALRKGGCQEGQGYYFSRPLPIDSFEKELNGTAENS